MRVFAPFAWLALMHVARGGELDEFSSSRARAARDYIASKKNHSKDTVDSFDSDPSPTRDDVLFNSFRIADANNDGRLSYDELISGMLFTWKDEERLEKALRAFGLPTMRDFMTTHDIDGDGYLDSVEFQYLLHPLDIPRKPEDTGHCPGLVSKIESCPTHLVLGCADYFRLSEGLCYSGHPNHVETCIMTESCENMCKCIGNVEAAMMGKAVMVLQNPDGTSVIYDPNHLEKRFLFLLFFLLTAVTALEYTALTLASIITSIGNAVVPQARWMDFKFWDGTNNPPSCTVYIYYGHCGAILSGTARNCPDGGSRVYGNSCKDHFRYGSRGCGFLGLGCQSLCYNVNEQGCPCSIFTWKELDDINLPGNDIRSIHVDQTSDCRNACSADSNCIAFTILPPTGEENQINCFLKQAPLPAFSMETDATSFLKLGGDSICTATLFEDGPYDSDWDPSSTSTKRDLLDPASWKGGLLAERAALVKDNVPFPFNADTLLIVAFLQFLYQGAQRFLTQEITTTSYPPIGNEIGSNTMQGTVQGQVGLTNTAAPRWAGNEITYRILQVFRNMMTVAATQPANPMTAYFNRAVDNSPLAQAMFPTAVRSLLTDNQQRIQNGPQPALTWNGRGVDTGSTDYATPFPNVEVGYDSRNNYFQRGNAGPFSLEAAFLLAAQVAGVDWNGVFRTGIAQTRRQIWFTGVIQPTLRAANGICMQQQSRTLGYVQAVPGSTTNAQRAGVYVALDLDPDLSPDDPNHNVFVFVVHTSDRASIINVPNTNNLLNMGVTRYVPEADDDAARFHLPDGSTTRAEPGQPGNPIPSTLSTRAFAHGHATVMNFQTFTNWVGQGPSNSPRSFPPYTPFGFIHIYILGEDFNALFPRLGYLNRGRGG